MNSHEQLSAIIARRQHHGRFDTSETVKVSGLALLKMLEHSSSGTPHEVIGILLGRFIDDYTVNVVDVFSTPQTSNDLNGENVENDFQQKMKEFLEKTGRLEEIIGWYHSHPGTGIWLSNVDVNTQMHREKINQRSIAVVIDAVKSVKGRVAIGAFRCIDQISTTQGEEPRETTSFVGHLEKPTTKQLVRGLNRQYYQLPVVTRMRPYEQQMLVSLRKGRWEDGLAPRCFMNNDLFSLRTINGLIRNASAYRRMILEEEGMTDEEREIRSVGKVDPITYIKKKTDKMTTTQINQLFVMQVDSLSF
ncbi:Clan MP, family M67, Poh1-like metallopeptidase [Tritrichomonas foetus]|uniref:Clan MP, family M67, Poh1-like metallopeptidase n=1 Tax=Tritrichomonas foetus TaxID=1144522 RepID=A0A1J4L222_9EUKA|nr:Clan MP, family M67, Poh1-like metallopeptidase [Tritrichomonas foetus]|eukprot:OHT17466.1 Clan MP, family M67, Poh1-like metallopeptidase [Tritrichomonas foetus]